MSFDVIAGKHTEDKDFSPRTFTLELLLRIVAPELLGGIYDIPNKSLLPFHQEWVGKRYVTLFERRPNVPEGTNTLRNQIMRQGAMVYGHDRFPAIQTANDDARKLLTAWIAEADIEDREREAILLGSVGSVAKHIRVLAPPATKAKPDPRARIYVDVHATLFLTPTFDPFRPDELIKVREKYKTDGQTLLDQGYDIAKEDLKKAYWFMREWDDQSEIWYVPWKVADEKKLIANGKVFTPEIDNSPGKTIQHKLGFCPWLWIKNLPMGKGVDGSCQFRAALDHAINLDYLESQIAAAVKYTMSPTMVIEKPANAVGAPVNDGKGEGFVKTPSTILVIDAEGKAYYLEISGEGIEKARLVAQDLRKAIIEAVHGDRVDPSEVTQGHQGAKSLAMLNQPMLGLCDQLKGSYGASLKRMLRMVLKIIEMRPCEVNEELVSSPGKVPDLHLLFGQYYTNTPAELLAQAQALDLNLRNGLLSRERGMNDIAIDYGISDIAAEQVLVTADQAENDRRAIALAAATAQVKVNDSISNG